VRTSSTKEEVILEVADDGAGMTDEIRKRCLEPFFTTKGMDGTGMGLSMVFGVAERHNGKIEIDSTPGIGTTFRMRLPLKDKAAKPRAAAEKPSLPMHILLVDDEEAVQDVVTELLSIEGHEVNAVSSALAGGSNLEGYRQRLP
jgi:hypothetical protein